MLCTTIKLTVSRDRWHLAPVTAATEKGERGAEWDRQGSAGSNTEPRSQEDSRKAAQGSRAHANPSCMMATAPCHAPAGRTRGRDLYERKLQHPLDLCCHPNCCRDPRVGCKDCLPLH